MFIQNYVDEANNFNSSLYCRSWRYLIDLSQIFGPLKMFTCNLHKQHSRPTNYTTVLNIFLSLVIKNPI